MFVFCFSIDAGRCLYEADLMFCFSVLNCMCACLVSLLMRYAVVNLSCLHPKVLHFIEKELSTLKGTFLKRKNSIVRLIDKMATCTYIRI